MEFYRLKIELGKKNAYAFPVFGYPTKSIHCKVCNRNWNSFENIVEYNLPFPITFVNDDLADFVSCEGCILVSKKVKEFIELAGICSPIFSEMPVIPKSEISEEVIKDHISRGYNVKNFLNEKPVYYMMGADIAANLHHDSNVVWIDSGESVCKYCGYGVGYQLKNPFAPYYIELSSWEKKDLFRVKEFGHALFCTEKFKKICIEQNFNGLKFEKICAK